MQEAFQRLVPTGEHVDKQVLRNQLVLMQTLGQLLPISHMSQVWLLNESKRTMFLLDRFDPPLKAKVA